MMTKKKDSDYRTSDSSYVKGRISDIVKVYSIKNSISGNFNYDTANRRIMPEGMDNLSNSISHTYYNKETDRITQKGNNTYRYDNCGRMVMDTGRDGTKIYRYDLQGKLARVYFSSARINPDPASSTEKEEIAELDNLMDDYDYDGNGFNLIEENFYSHNGLLIHQKIKKTMRPMESLIKYLYKGIKTNNVSYNHSGWLGQDNKSALNKVKQIPWENYGKKIIVGWSVGGDTTAQFLQKYKPKNFDDLFELAIIEGANVHAYLRPDQILDISTKTKRLLLITHNKDLLNNPLFGCRQSSLIDDDVLPHNTIVLRMDNGHSNKYSDVAAKWVLQNWNRIKDFGLNEILWKNEIIKSFRSLETMPERYPFLDVNFIPPNRYHKMVISNRYLVLYQIKDSTVYIDFIVDCRQDYKWLVH